MQIQVSQDISITELRAADRAACVALLNERDIFRNTLRIPFPYANEHFDSWFEIVTQLSKQYGEPVHFVVRDANDDPIGAVGFDSLTKEHSAEIGYWLGKPFWGRGIMTKVVEKAVMYAFDRWNLVRIAGHVFTFNDASARVLEKNSFQLEGVLRKHQIKGGVPIDTKLYALTR